MNMNTMDKNDTTVVAKNLPRSENLSKELVDFFINCGPISSIKIEDEIRGHEKLSKAIITFKDYKAAQDAVNMTSQFFEGRAVEVDYASQRIESLEKGNTKTGAENVVSVDKNMDQGVGKILESKDSEAQMKLAQDMRELWRPEQTSDKVGSSPFDQRTESDSTMNMDQGVGKILESKDSEAQMKLAQDMRELWRPEQTHDRVGTSPFDQRTESDTSLNIERGVDRIIESEDSESQLKFARDMREIWRPEQTEERLGKPETTSEKIKEKVEVAQEKVTDFVHRIKEKVHPSETTEAERERELEKSRLAREREREALAAEHPSSPRI